VISNPGADLQLEPGDAVGILGTPEQRADFRAIAGSFAADSPQGIADR
jgi:hypothetical protein